jgi:hypothetical protein
VLAPSIFPASSSPAITKPGPPRDVRTAVLPAGSAQAPVSLRDAEESLEPTGNLM